MRWEQFWKHTKANYRKEWKKCMSSQWLPCGKDPYLLIKHYLCWLTLIGFRWKGNTLILFLVLYIAVNLISTAGAPSAAAVGPAIATHISKNLEQSR